MACRKGVDGTQGKGPLSWRREGFLSTSNSPFGVSWFLALLALVGQSLILTSKAVEAGLSHSPRARYYLGREGKKKERKRNRLCSPCLPEHSCTPSLRSYACTFGTLISNQRVSARRDISRVACKRNTTDIESSCCLTRVSREAILYIVVV